MTAETRAAEISRICGKVFYRRPSFIVRAYTVRYVQSQLFGREVPINLAVVKCAPPREARMHESRPGQARRIEGLREADGMLFEAMALAARIPHPSFTAGRMVLCGNPS